MEENPITLAEFDDYWSKLSGSDLVIVEVVRRAINKQDIRKSDLDALDKIAEEHFTQQTELELRGESCPRLAEVWIALGLREVCKRDWTRLPQDLLMALKATPKGELVLE